MLTLCAAALALAVEASPAEARFTFQGKVLDATRAPIAAAKVTVVPDAQGHARPRAPTPRASSASISAEGATRSASSRRGSWRKRSR